jgi:mono/diheme cytochrome c family protein
MTDESIRMGHPHRSIIVPLAAVLALFGATTASLAQTPAGPAQNAFAGAQVFGEKGCVKCHAVRGLGGDEGPDLGASSERKTFYELAAHMWNHVPRMVERMGSLGIDRPQMTAQETSDLIAFLFTLDYFDPPGDAAHGRELFTEKRCVMCHQVGGVGGVIGPNLEFVSYFGSPIQVAAAMWNHGPAMDEAMNALGIERSSVSGSELIDLISYLESAAGDWPQGPLHVLPGRADEGRRLVVEKGCIDCHSILGRGGRLGPDLAGGRGRRSMTEFAAAMLNKAPAMRRALRARGLSVPKLSAVQMADLVAYLHSVQYFADSGDPDRGRLLLRDKGCLACHSLNGRGGTNAPDLAAVRGVDSPGGMAASLWNHAPAMYESGIGEVWPTFTPSEMADLGAFLESLAVPR